MEKVDPDKEELQIRQQIFGVALVSYITKSRHDSIEWLMPVLPLGFDFDALVNVSDKQISSPALEAAIGGKPKVIKWLGKNGSIPAFHYGNGRHIDIRTAIEEARINATLSRIVTCGIVGCFFGESKFGDFLTKGIYDCRLLICIIDFVYDNEASKKRKL